MTNICTHTKKYAKWEDLKMKVKKIKARGKRLVMLIVVEWMRGKERAEKG